MVQAQLEHPPWLCVSYNKLDHSDSLKKQGIRDILPSHQPGLLNNRYIVKCAIVTIVRLDKIPVSPFPPAEQGMAVQESFRIRQWQAIWPWAHFKAIPPPERLPTVQADLQARENPQEPDLHINQADLSVNLPIGRGVQLRFTELF